MTQQPIPPVGELLAARVGEELALNDSYLNPQMGRILRTLGFDKTWAGGQGAHLIDAEDYQELLAPLLPELTERTGRRQAARRHVPACSAPVACQQPVHLNGCTTSSTSGGCGRGARSSQTTWPGCPGRSSMATPGRPISSHRRRAGAV